MEILESNFEGKEMSKGRSFENALADPEKYDLPALRRLSKSYKTDSDSWLRQQNLSYANQCLDKKALVDAEIERRQANG